MSKKSHNNKQIKKMEKKWGMVKSHISQMSEKLATRHSFYNVIGFAISDSKMFSSSESWHFPVAHVISRYLPPCVALEVSTHIFNFISETQSLTDIQHFPKEKLYCHQIEWAIKFNS